jgi:hypothetical protein
MSTTKQTCIACLRYVAFCECTGGPRLQRHPTDCACSMCEQGRAILSGSYVEPSDDESTN